MLSQIKNEYVTVTEAAYLLGVSYAKMVKMVKDKKIESEKFGRDIAIKRSDVVRLKEQTTTGGDLPVE